MEDSILKMAIESASKIEILGERFDRHLKTQGEHMVRQDDHMIRLESKIDALTDKIADARISQLKDDRATNRKLYALNGLISAIVSMLIYFLRSK